MNPYVKEKWTTALRSGKYAQSRGVLESSRGFCCLGVLCDIAVKEGVIERRVPNDNMIFFGTCEEFEDEDMQAAYLPQSVADWAGLYSTKPAVRVYDSNKMLAHLNDGLCMPFSKIADLIEDQL